MSSTTPPTASSSDPQAATNNTQIVEERVVVAASSAVSRPTEVIASSSAAAAGDNGGSTGGRSANVSDGEVVIEFNSRIISSSRYHQQQPSESYAWGMLAGLSGLTAVISLALLMGGLLNRDGFKPAWATICFWSSSLFVFANRQRISTATPAVNGLDPSLERADEPRVLDKASRQALLTYFVFNPSEENQGATPVVPAKSADVTSPPDDLEAQVTPVLTYSAEDESTNAEGAGLSTPAGNILEREPSRTGSSKWVTNGTCIICLGEYKSGDRLCRMPCRHVYHAKCIDEWLDRATQPSCPLCKKDLRGEVAAARSSATLVRPSEGTLLDTSGIGVA